MSKTNADSNEFDDKNYWKARHVGSANLKASGIKSIKVKSNEYVYKMLADQYLKLLHGMEISGVKSVIDCGFGDGYFLDFFEKNFPDLDVHGVDISPAAKDKVKFKKKDNLYIGDLTKFQSDKKFDIVHCFDVLYHVLSDDDYEKSLTNIAKLSQKYVILHERFFDKAPAISAKHVRMRRSDYTNQILNSHGFYLIKEIPSHFFAMRFLTYRLNNLTPGLLYKVDKYIADKIHPSTQESFASHHIRIYATR